MEATATTLVGEEGTVFVGVGEGDGETTGNGDGESAGDGDGETTGEGETTGDGDGETGSTRVMIHCIARKESNYTYKITLTAKKTILLHGSTKMETINSRAALEVHQSLQ